MGKHQQSSNNQRYDSQHGDPYLKPPSAGAALCPQCGVSYQQGRWAWHERQPDDAPEQHCPACQRIADDEPAGRLQLSGGFLREHREEIINLIRNTEQAHKAQHALERLLRISDQDDGLLVTTTGLHLANRIGHGLSAAFKGQTEYSYSADERFVSIHWQRD